MPEPIPFPIRSALAPTIPPDDAERRRALDPTHSFIVQAPAGSGKTHLLTQRYLRLLALAQRPDEIVAITFTLAAAAEMRNRILDALEKAERSITAGDSVPADQDPLSIPALAIAALLHSSRMGWQLLDQPAQLRIMTIDAFCRFIAMQTPLSWGLLSGLGSLETTDQPDELYHLAARRLLDRAIASPSAARTSIEALLLWRDNNWHDVEAQIVEMLKQRNRWYQDFVFARDLDFNLLRQRLEAPMRRACHQQLAILSDALDKDLRTTILELARAACENPGENSPFSLAECAELPAISANEPLHEAFALDDAASLFRNLASFLLIGGGTWRKPGGLNAKLGFPPGKDGQPLKARMGQFLAELAQQPGLEESLAAFLEPMPTAYSQDEWSIIRHCFVVLREAWAELQLVFSETGLVDFTEIAQIALRILTPSEDTSYDFTLRLADQIHHLLIDEFQDTSRNQHQLLARLIAAWPETTNRTCFCVGDPMQSIYGFREAEVELFERLKSHGLDLPNDANPFRFESVTLQANFRTTPTLVKDLNQHFSHIFPVSNTTSAPDEVQFSAAIPVRPANSTAATELHLDFTLATRGDISSYPHAAPEITRHSQLDRIVALIRDHLHRAEAAHRLNPQAKYRIAVLGRTRNTLVRVAEALHAAALSFRAVEIVPLRERPEILDALALARALLNPDDRRAWLGILRAPWCGLSLAELHALTSADDAHLLATPIPVLLATRLPILAESGSLSAASANTASRLFRVLQEAQSHRAEAATFSLGTWIQSIWKALGGPATIDAEAHANLQLLWQTLDQLPNGEPDLLGSALDAALDGLYALPDPSASSDFGVQLMTIHQSKGLEFEIVIVPELEAGNRSYTPAMISWLERGLPARTPSDSEASDEALTEFLIAPIQSKGVQAGDARKWVDRVKRERELREMRRLLYVAATRAREELHIFARPSFTPGKGSPVLGKASGLLDTAWPAFVSHIEAEFQRWLANHDSAASTALPALAAHAEPIQPEPAQPELFAPPTPTRLRRLPAGYTPPDTLLHIATPNTAENGVLPADPALTPYERTHGGLYSRLEGIAIHAFLEEFARFAEFARSAESTQLHPSTPGALDLSPAAIGKVTALLRSRGLSPAAAAELAAESLLLARRALVDPIGSWILAPHPRSSVESSWTGMVRSSEASTTVLRHLRPDRVFFAPPHTGTGPESWWIIDYKTTRANIPSGQTFDSEARQNFLETHRLQYATQLHAYAQLLRGLEASGSNSPIQIHAGIFYPRLLLFDSWPL